MGTICLADIWLHVYMTAFVCVVMAISMWTIICTLCVWAQLPASNGSSTHADAPRVQVHPLRGAAIHRTPATCDLWPPATRSSLHTMKGSEVMLCSCSFSVKLFSEFIDIYCFQCREITQIQMDEKLPKKEQHITRGRMFEFLFDSLIVQSN